MFEYPYLWTFTLINNGKDPGIRKSASELLEMKFFKKAKGCEYIKDKLIKILKPLEEMVFSIFNNSWVALVICRLKVRCQKYSK